MRIVGQIMNWEMSREISEPKYSAFGSRFAPLSVGRTIITLKISADEYETGRYGLEAANIVVHDGNCAVRVNDRRGKSEATDERVAELEQKPRAFENDFDNLVRTKCAQTEREREALKKELVRVRDRADFLDKQVIELRQLVGKQKQEAAEKIAAGADARMVNLDIEHGDA